MNRLPKGTKAQVMGTRLFQTMYTADQMRKAVADEREACAKVCDDMAFDWQKYVTTPSGTITACAAAIRARGNA